MLINAQKSSLLRRRRGGKKIKTGCKTFLILHPSLLLRTFNHGEFHHVCWLGRVTLLRLYLFKMFLEARMNEISNNALLKKGLDSIEVKRNKSVFYDRMCLWRIYFYVSSEADFFFVFLDHFTILHFVIQWRAS